jgi:hypothetical protein
VWDGRDEVSGDGLVSRIRPAGAQGSRIGHHRPSNAFSRARLKMDSTCSFA